MKSKKGVGNITHNFWTPSSSDSVKNCKRNGDNDDELRVINHKSRMPLLKLADGPRLSPNEVISLSPFL